MAAFICIPHAEWLYYKQQQNKCHETLHVVLIIIYTNTDMKYLKLDTRQPDQSMNSPSYLTCKWFFVKANLQCNVSVVGISVCLRIIKRSIKTLKWIWSFGHQVRQVGFLRVLRFPPTRRPYERKHRYQRAWLILSCITCF